MKRYTSVPMLHIRSTIYKILFVFALMAASEYYLFRRLLHQRLKSQNLEELIRLGLGNIFTDSKIHFVFLAGFLLISMVLLFHGIERKEKISYTIRRLRIREKEYFIIQGLYYTFVYILLLVFQLALILILSLSYFKAVPDTNYSNQTLFLIFYSNNFLHNLLPLEETVKVIRNLLMYPALGFSCAFLSYAQRRGGKHFAFFLLSFLVVLDFQTALGSFLWDSCVIVLSAIILVLIAANILKKGDGYEF